MSSTHIQLVKWSFPAFALVIGLLWYKRRRVDRADPGGIIEADSTNKTLANNYEKESSSSKPTISLYDSGIHIDVSFSLNNSNQPAEEPMNCSPRKVSESLDIPTRKSASQPISMQSEASYEESQSWYNHEESSPSKTNVVQLGSNPKTSNFDMIARSRSSSSFENAGDINGKVMKIFENVAEEEEVTAVAQKTSCEDELQECSNKKDSNDQTEKCSYIENEQQPLTNTSEETTKAQTQALSERDSANHSPVSGVLEGSVTDEARSEGSTDSGKGGSIKGHAKDNAMPMIYVFSIPQNLVGKLIGRHGHFLQSIRDKAEVHIVVKHHPTSRNHKICAIEGTTEGINVALDIIRQKFPEKKYPQVTLEQIQLLKVPEDIPWVTELMQLSLVEGVNNDVVVCHIVKPNRFFVQLPTHPTYPSLRILDENMTQLYNTTESPSVPDELSKGMIVVAKWYDKWVRVYVEQPDPAGERHLVRLVDHGGYWFFSNTDMRKIRSDYLTLPFQAIEIFLANVQPKNGEWNQEAFDIVGYICSGVVGQAQIESYIDTNTYVNLYFNIQKHGVISLADELIARGYADPIALETIIPEGVSASIQDQAIHIRSP